MNKITKKKKLIILITTVFVVALVALAGYVLFARAGDDWQLQISDVSKDCFSNTLNVYTSKDYKVVSGVGDKVIAKGKSTYPRSLSYLVNELIEVMPDSEQAIYNKYKVGYSEDGDITYISVSEDNPELKIFLDTIKIENLFWCD